MRMRMSVLTFAFGSGAATPVSDRELFHHAPANFRTSVMQPPTAAAAAMAGLARCVRAPGPWRPSKLRFEVETHACAARRELAVRREAHRAARLTPLESGVAEHAIEAFRLGRRASPCSEPGTTQARTFEATLRPLATAAALRRSGEAAVGAGADEHHVDRRAFDARSRRETDIGERLRHHPRARRIGGARRDRGRGRRPR